LDRRFKKNGGIQLYLGEHKEGSDGRQGTALGHKSMKAGPGKGNPSQDPKAVSKKKEGRNRGKKGRTHSWKGTGLRKEPKAG